MCARLTFELCNLILFKNFSPKIDQISWQKTVVRLYVQLDGWMLINRIALQFHFILFHLTHPEENDFQRAFILLWSMIYE